MEFIMKKLITTIVAFSLLSTSVIFAQEREIIIKKTFDGDYMTEEHHFGGQMGGRWMGGKHFGKREFQNRSGGNVKRLIARADELGLSSEQIKTIKEMSFDFKMNSFDQQAAVKKASLKLKMIKSDQESSQEMVFTAIDDLARLKTDVAKAKYTFHKSLHSVLSDKQQEMLKERPRMDRKMKMKKEGKKRKGYRERQKG